MESVHYLPSPNPSCTPPPPDPALLHSHSWWHSHFKNRDRRDSAGFSENMGSGIQPPNRIEGDEGLENRGVILGRSTEKAGMSLTTNLSYKDLQQYEHGLSDSLEMKKTGQLFLEVEKSNQRTQSGDIYDLVDKTSTGFKKTPSSISNIDKFIPTLTIGKNFIDEEITVGNTDTIISRKYEQPMTNTSNNTQESEAKSTTYHGSGNPLIPSIRKNITIIEGKKPIKDFDSNCISLPTITKKPIVINSDSNYSIHSTIIQKPLAEDPNFDCTLLPIITNRPMVEDHNSDDIFLPAITKKPLVADSDYDDSILPKITVIPSPKTDTVAKHINATVTLAKHPLDTFTPISENTPLMLPLAPEEQQIQQKLENSEMKSSFISRKLSSFLQSSFANNWFFKNETSNEESDIESAKSVDFNRSESEASETSTESTSTSSLGAPEGIMLRRNSKWNAVRDAVYNHPQKLREMNTWQPQD